MKIDDPVFSLSLKSELWVVSQHLELLKRAVNDIIEKERISIWDKYDLNDADEVTIGSKLEEDLNSGHVTRLLTGSAILAIWAMYETAVKRCADILRQKKKSNLKMSDLKGAFLEKAGKYYGEVLQAPLHPASVDMSRLRWIAAVRNAFAHANGELEHVNEKDLDRILDLARKNDQLKIDTGSLIVTMEFVSDCWDFLRPLIEELIERTKATYRDDG